MAVQRSAHDDGPDAADGWDRLADGYQREIGWPDDELTWGWRCPPESELRLVIDLVPGADVLSIGCGGGQDLVALGRLGAASLVGVDPSRVQLRHARARLDAAGVEARLELGRAEALETVGDASVDVAVSVQALNYVGDLPGAVAELRRVLRPGGVAAFSVMHPAEASTSDRPPYTWHTSWFEVERDWEWDGMTDEPIPFRSWFHSPSDWFTALTDGGLVVERLLEPAPIHDDRWIERGWLDEDSSAKLDLVPATIVLRARRPTP